MKGQVMRINRGTGAFLRLHAIGVCALFAGGLFPAFPAYSEGLPADEAEEDFGLSEMKIVETEVVYEYRPADPKAKWRDDSAWMNCKAEISVVKEGATDVLSMELEAKMQTVVPVPLMLKGELAYRLEVDYRTEGQVEGVSFYFRTIPPPYTYWGGAAGEPLRTERARAVGRFRNSKSSPRGIGFFCNASGSGKVIIYGARLTQMEDFERIEREVPAGCAYMNGNFRNLDSGWATLPLSWPAPFSTKSAASPVWNGSGFQGVGTIASREKIKLVPGVSYTLELHGKPNGWLAYGIRGSGPKSVKVKLDANSY